MVPSVERPNNHTISTLDTEMGSSIFFTEGDTDSCGPHNISFVPTQKDLDGLWEVIFDGSA